ncbi:MAG: membrane integrity-associated transporter subunit PqiC [Desulfamplus sp.]|nr:membrane integrity-associated transporter subunit PqiC [Desulfamplus sp.]
MEKYKNIIEKCASGYRRIIVVSIVFPVILTFMGCISSDPSKFYTLSPVKNLGLPLPESTKLPLDPTPGTDAVTLAIGPVNIPRYLDRSQLVVRLSENEIRLEDFHQWAGLLREDIPFVLMENISQILGIDTIYRHPWQSHVVPEYQTHIDILQLDGMPGGYISVSAKWEIIEAGTRKRIHMDKAEFTETVEGTGFDDYVAAQSKALGQLSLLISLSLKRSLSL